MPVSAHSSPLEDRGILPSQETIIARRASWLKSQWT